MSSYVKQITDAIEEKLIYLIPPFVKSTHTWSAGAGGVKAKNTFKVLPGQAKSVEGSLRTITMNQDFSVSLITNYKADNDTTLQTEIETIYSSLELVTNEAMQRRFAIARIMSVSGFELSAPEIDHELRTITIGATYSVFYRME